MFLRARLLATADIAGEEHRWWVSGFAPEGFNHKREAACGAATHRHFAAPSPVCWKLFLTDLKEVMTKNFIITRSRCELLTTLVNS